MENMYLKIHDIKLEMETIIPFVLEEKYTDERKSFGWNSAV